MKNNLTYLLGDKISALGMKELAGRIEGVMDKFIEKNHENYLYPKAMAEMESFVEDVMKSIESFQYYEEKVLDSIENPGNCSTEELKEIDKKFFRQVRIYFHDGRQPQSGNINEIQERKDVLNITYVSKLQILGINEAGQDTSSKDAGWHLSFESGFSGYFQPVRKGESYYYCGCLKLERYNDLIQVINCKIIRK